LEQFSLIFALCTQSIAQQQVAIVFLLFCHYRNHMIAIIKTNNTVTLSYAQSVLNDHDIGSFIADTHASILDGSVGAIPRRLMVLDEDVTEAHEILAAVGLEDEFCQI